MQTRSGTTLTAGMACGRVAKVSCNTEGNCLAVVVDLTSSDSEATGTEDELE